MIAITEFMVQLNINYTVKPLRKDTSGYFTFILF